MAIIPPVQRIEALETLTKRLERELAELREQQGITHGLCEMRYDRLVAQRDGTYEPRGHGCGDKQCRDPIRVADFASGHKKGMGS